MDYNKVQTEHCFQYQRRLDMALVEAHDDELLAKIDATDFSFYKAVVKPIEIKEAKAIIERYEYLGNIAAFNKFAFGLFFGDLLSGVVIFGSEYSINLPFWQEKYGMNKDNTLLLNRGVCTWWCPKNANSFLVSNAIKQLPEQYKVITCTVDPMAKEKGTIYQACNFHYLGSMRDSNPNLKTSGKRDRTACIIDGKLLSSRAMRNKFGTMKKAVILEQYPDAEFIKVRSKHRYVFFRGSHKERKTFKNNFKDLIKPYPKTYIE
ncbi:MAG: hypothetical protein PQJ49_13945 [Sphaerochaetaceae bacterium]|nr:hypothetical protein [Sphaerochaetaceae bacterium]